MSSICPLCDGRCDGADFKALLTPELAWLWAAVAKAGDRRGDPHLVEGAPITVTAPADPASRAAVSGLYSRPIWAGQGLRVPLDKLNTMVRARGHRLTPGSVAAHATGRPLALKAAQRTVKRAQQDSIMGTFVAACDRNPRLAGMGEALFEQLRQGGWPARILKGTDPEGLARTAVGVVGQILGIPDGERFDRRLLVPGDPHALDDGKPLAGLVLAMLASLGVISNLPAARRRSAWGQAGIDCDNLTGGLTVLGIHPAGWTIPSGVTCTVPPRELAEGCWSTPPARGQWVFVTENPSVLASAADLVAREPAAAKSARLLCTMGTPSDEEIDAIAGLAAAGWGVAVRADFDAAGIRHVTRLLDGVPGAIPWRMTALDFAESQPLTETPDPCPPTPWDPELANAMEVSGSVAFEEALLPALLEDLRAGIPPRRPHWDLGNTGVGSP